MVSLLRCDSNYKDFKDLIKLLDNDLNKRYGKVQSTYDKYNVIQSIQTVVIAKDNSSSVGCGCFKKYDDDTVEIKRMYVKPEYRGQGISKKILAELEKWAKELGFSKAILETGIKQPEAIGLYNNSEYNRIDNYGQYVGLSNSVCFGKDLKLEKL